MSTLRYYSIFKLIMTIDSGILSKNHVSCNFMLKYYYITIILQVISLNNILINGNYLKKIKIACTLKTTVYEHIVFI